MTASVATVQFVDQLRLRGVKLWVEGTRLRYNAPKGVINDDVLNELRKRKDEILLLLNQESASHDNKSIQPVARDGLLPLSFAQQRIWFLDELEPDNPFYNVALAKQISGPVNTDQLRESLLTLIRRHEVLRATCVNTNDGPRLAITAADAIDPDGAWFSVEELPETTTDAELEQRVNAEVTPALPLSQVPLLRTRLFRRGNKDAVLAFTTHHFVVDGWSCGVLMRELSVIYAALNQGTVPELPPLNIQYADFAGWQNNWLKGPDLDRQLQYWKETLDGVSTLELPTDKPRPPVQTYRGDIHHFALPAETGQQLKALSRNEGLTLYMTLLAAFQVLLHRYSQQDEVVLGTAVSNRHSAELEGLLGPFLNTLVLRGNLAGNPTFRELIHATRDVALGAFAHQDLPFELLVEHLKPERDRSRTPFFQVLFVVHQYSGEEELALAGTTTVDYPVAPGTTMYDLFLQLIELNDSYTGSIEYSTDLFSAATIERMSAHFVTLLQSIAANPDAPILDLPLMESAERQQLLTDWNNTSADYASELQLQQVIEQQAAATPERVAVVHLDEQMSYAGLNERGNQLAHHLLSTGVGAGDLVGIYLERSVDMMVALLGILKTGAAYVPLDPLFPPERIRFMMDDAGLKALVTQSSLQDDLDSKPEQVICIDTARGALDQLATTTPPATGSATDLAYVIYTSGSTGQPKGVQLEHRGVVNFLTTMAQQPGLQSGDTLVAVTTLSFDIAVLELFMPLCNGARLVIADKDVSADGSRLAELITMSNATVMQATPATWQLLLGSGWPGKPGLKILCGGEPLPRELADRLLATGAELWNMYGPTETTIWSSVAKVPMTGPITIGRPIANTQMYIVDEQLRPVPVGVPGELCIGGDGVARGYLNRPGLSAERFVDDPFNNEGKLYRTGDLARFRGDGEIECLGRNDNQVKLRGYRIELGEIEAVMAQHPAVTQAVAAAREDREGDKRLVGYLITDIEAASNTELAAWKDDQLEQWRDLWENAYTEEQTLDPSFNISGWNSSYSGKPIPAAEMREWVEVTAERINGLQPRRVLEIGSGTGLLVARVAAGCERYLATDFSPAAIASIEALQASRDDLHAVEARQTHADSLSELDEQFDVIIVNSVAQYFPDQQYFLEVLSTASRLLSDGGHLFLGDLRSLTLLEAYHTSVQLWQADAELSLHELGERVRQRVEQEEELLIEPQFFTLAQPAMQRASNVEFQLKRGVTRNEMSCFRYDAIVQFGGPSSPPLSPQRVDWLNLGDTEALHSRLSKLRPTESMLVAGIPDQRLQPEVISMTALSNPGEGTVADLRRTIDAAQADGVEPEAIYALAATAERNVQLISTGPGRFNALFTRANHAVDGRLMLPARDLSLEQSTNNPMQGRVQRSLIPALKEHMRALLPEYMVPAVFAIMTGFPLTPNGKIDRNALPAPDQGSAATYTPPRNPTEEQLVSIWEGLLGVDQVGVLDDFFGLGGHSLLATQLIARIRDGLQVNLPLNTLFDDPTVAGLAKAIETLQWATTQSNNDAADGPDDDLDDDLEEIEI